MQAQHTQVLQAEKQQVHLQYQQQMEQQVFDRVDLFPANQCDVDSIGGLNRQQKEWEKQKESELKRWRDEQEKESRQMRYRIRNHTDLDTREVRRLIAFAGADLDFDRGVVWVDVRWTRPHLDRTNPYPASGDAMSDMRL